MELKKYRNIGGLDRVLRSVVTVIMIYYGFVDTALIGQTLISTLVGIFGVINGIVTLVGVCPAYTLAGISTVPKNPA